MKRIAFYHKESKDNGVAVNVVIFNEYAKYYKDSYWCVDATHRHFAFTYFAPYSGAQT